MVLSKGVIGWYDYCVEDMLDGVNPIETNTHPKTNRIGTKLF